MFTLSQFAAKFENKGSLGGQTSIRERLHVLATKGHVKFVRGDRPRTSASSGTDRSSAISASGTCSFAPTPR